MLKLISKTFDNVLAVMACGLVVALLIAVSTGIISRAMGAPQVWTEELSTFLMVWLSTFGWMVATRRAAHIRVRFFNNMLPIPARRSLETLFLLLAVLVGVVLSYYGLSLIAANHDVSAITLPFSTAWLYVPIIPAGLVVAGQAIADIVALWSQPELQPIEGRVI
jgi:TRAP-type transport system small permease protein